MNSLAAFPSTTEVHLGPLLLIALNYHDKWFINSKAPGSGDCLHLGLDHREHLEDFTKFLDLGMVAEPMSYVVVGGDWTI